MFTETPPYTPGRLFRIANRFMAVLFLVGIALNLARPDLFTWMAVFGTAFLACLLATSAHLHWILPSFLSLICIVMAFVLFSDLAGVVDVAERAYESALLLDPRDVQVQQLRDMINLAVIAIWMGVLGVVEYRRRSVVEG